MERNTPLCILLLIIFWHVNMSCRVKWGEAYSEEFFVPLGVKQGGISSPSFFTVYVDDMIGILMRSGIGFHLVNVFVGCLLFADDLALLAPSQSALQRMVNLCHEYCLKYCLQINSAKSKVMLS